MSGQIIDSAAFKQWLGDDAELAVLDLREEAQFGKGDPLYATNLPLRRLAAEAPRFIPRKSVRTVLVDDGSGVAEEAARVLEGLGYGAVNILAGGIPAWIKDGTEGLPTFDIPGLAFSEAVRKARSTPSLSARELEKLYAEGADVIVLDARTPEEFAIDHVPGARNVPGAELVHRFADVAPSPSTLVLVSCAGLPRAIIGAQTLIDVGVPNRVALLEEGTKGWRDAGLALETGAGAPLGSVSEAAVEFAKRHIATLAAHADIPRMDLDGLAEALKDDSRTTYVLDVRTPEEYASGHIPGSISAPGGQLLAVSFRAIAVRGARIVLVDDAEGVRATTTAHWLRRRGFDLRILRHDFAKAAPELADAAAAAG